MREDAIPRREDHHVARRERVKRAAIDHEDVARRDRGTHARAHRAQPHTAEAVERVFETMALACGKIVGTQQSCRVNRRNS